MSPSASSGNDLDDYYRHGDIEARSQRFRGSSFYSVGLGSLLANLDDIPFPQVVPDIGQGFDGLGRTMFRSSKSLI